MAYLIQKWQYCLLVELLLMMPPAPKNINLHSNQCETVTGNPNLRSAPLVRFQSFSPSPFSPQHQHIVTSATADSAELRKYNGVWGWFYCVCKSTLACDSVCMFQWMLQTQMSQISQYFNKINITALPFIGCCPRWWLIIHEVANDSYKERVNPAWRYDIYSICSLKATDSHHILV